MWRSEQGVNWNRWRDKSTDEETLWRGLERWRKVCDKNPDEEEERKGDRERK